MDERSCIYRTEPADRQYLCCSGDQLVTWSGNSSGKVLNETVIYDTRAWKWPANYIVPPLLLTTRLQYSQTSRTLKTTTRLDALPRNPQIIPKRDVLSVHCTRTISSPNCTRGLIGSPTPVTSSARGTGLFFAFDMHWDGHSLAGTGSLHQSALKEQGRVAMTTM